MCACVCGCMYVCLDVCVVQKKGYPRKRKCYL